MSHPSKRQCIAMRTPKALADNIALIFLSMPNLQRGTKHVKDCLFKLVERMVMILSQERCLLGLLRFIYRILRVKWLYPEDFFQQVALESIDSFYVQLMLCAFYCAPSLPWGIILLLFVWVVVFFCIASFFNLSKEPVVIISELYLY